MSAEKEGGGASEGSLMPGQHHERLGLCTHADTAPALLVLPSSPRPEPERLCSDVAAVNVSIHFPHYEGCVTPDRNSPMMMPWMQGGRQFKSHKVAYR